ncbi:hypothetical protein LTR74_002183 [Friedmanniomyces endolithicus]|nr:hypothetical protein LTR74_002183 [Friedmanniomyces endolithicus]
MEVAALCRKASRAAIARGEGGLDARLPVNNLGSLAKYRHGPVNPWSAVPFSPQPTPPSPHSPETLTPPARTQRLSPLFRRLPAEIRNRIYVLSFLGGDNMPRTQQQDPEIQGLLSARPPMKALLLTCRRVYREARGVYMGSYRAYWRTKAFVVDERGELEYDFVAPFSGEDLEEVRELVFRTSVGLLCDGRVRDGNGGGVMARLREMIGDAGGECGGEVEFMRCRDGSWACLNVGFKALTAGGGEEVQRFVLVPDGREGRNGERGFVAGLDGGAGADVEVMANRPYEVVKKWEVSALLDIEIA